ncbi:MAG: chorismate mutase [Clostridia bacterium]|nr:chorismate mutase [Clostridia bacterium]
MELSEIRSKIDDIDDDIAELFVKRMELSEKVAEIKAETGKQITDLSREREIIFRLSQKVPKELTLYIKELYETVFFTGKAYQSAVIGKTSETVRRLRTLIDEGLTQMPTSATVACQGIKGANSGAAAQKFFPVSDLVYVKNFAGVFNAVESGLCEFGVLPIENSTAGSVLEVYDLMRKHNFHIVRSTRVRISHCLAALPSAETRDIKKVLSHPQALLQSEEFLKKLDVKAEADENTAIAARRVAEGGDKSVAALCSEECAAVYGLKVLKKDVQDSDANYTRFICIKKDLCVYKGADKMSVMTSLSHEPGSLNRILGRFSALGLNLTKLESRPIVGSDFEFMFYFDFEGDVTEPAVQNLIAELENGSENFVFLGAYKEKI